MAFPKVAPCALLFCLSFRFLTEYVELSLESATFWVTLSRVVDHDSILPVFVVCSVPQFSLVDNGSLDPATDSGS